MSHFRHLSKAVRQEAVARGVIKSAADYAGVSAATASRTFAGKIKYPNLKVIAALKRALAEIEHAKREVA